MAMSSRDKSADDEIRISDKLPSLIASLGFRQRPNFEDIDDEDTYLLHWALCILQCAGLEPVVDFEFDKSFGGPFSTVLEQVLEHLDWELVSSASAMEDTRVDAVQEEMAKGDEFLLALATAASVVAYNPGISMRDTTWMVRNIRPELHDIAAEACDFGEANIWSK